MVYGLKRLKTITNILNLLTVFKNLLLLFGDLEPTKMEEKVAKKTENLKLIT